MSKRSKILAAMMVGLFVVAGSVGVFFLVSALNRIPIRVTPPDVEEAQLVEEGGRILVRYRPAGQDEAINQPVEEYFRLVYDQRRSYTKGRLMLMKTLNISSPGEAVWVVLGLVGQVLFAGRMIVQWIASEKERRSVVPTAFWWLAIAGASLLIVYFIWRKDVIGILGQATGWVIYVRNLYFIYAGGHETATVQGEPSTPAPAAETQDDRI